MKRIFPAFFFLAVFLAAAAPADSFSRSHFDSPAAFVVDPATGAYYVSNVNGLALKKDGNGYISKISPNGNLVIQKFIGGRPGIPVLDAPKGLLVLDDQIWAADIDAVKVFDRDSGRLLRTVDASGVHARLLNGLASDGHVVYVSDTLNNQILKINPAADFEVTIFKRGGELTSPNGLAFNPRDRSLMVTSFLGGQLLEIDRHGKLHMLKKGLSTPGGLDYDREGNLYVSSFDRGEIYKIPRYGRGLLSVFQNNLTTPSDLSCDRRKNELLIPSYRGNAVTTLLILDKAHQRDLPENG